MTAVGVAVADDHGPETEDDGRCGDRDLTPRALSKAAEGTDAQAQAHAEPGARSPRPSRRFCTWSGSRDLADGLNDRLRRMVRVAP